jgi:hypothetical protein
MQGGKKWYLSHVKEREVKYDSLSALLHQLPIVSNTTPLAYIQSIKISFDNRIKIIMEDIENMTHVLENTHTPNFYHINWALCVKNIGDKWGF